MTAVLRSTDITLRGNWLFCSLEGEHTAIRVSDIEAVRRRPSGSHGMWKLAIHMRSGQSYRFLMETSGVADGLVEALSGGASTT